MTLSQFWFSFARPVCEGHISESFVGVVIVESMDFKTAHTDICNFNLIPDIDQCAIQAFEIPNESRYDASYLNRLLVKPEVFEIGKTLHRIVPE